MQRKGQLWPDKKRRGSRKQEVAWGMASKDAMTRYVIPGAARNDICRALAHEREVANQYPK